MDPKPFEHYGRSIPEPELNLGVNLHRFQDIRYGSIELHCFQYYEFMFVVNGFVTIQTEDEELPARPGAFIICPPRVNHATKIPESTRDYHRYVIHVMPDVYLAALERFDLVNSSVDFLNDKLQVFQFDSIDIANIMSYIDAFYNHITNNDAYSALGIVNILAEILLHIERYNRKHRAITPGKNSSIAVLAKEVIENNYRDSLLSLDSIANQLYVNKSYLARVYRESYNLTVYQTIIDRRLLRATELLHQGTPVKQAYLDSGFKDYSAFLKAFKKKYSVLPTEYLKELSGT